MPSNDVTRRDDVVDEYHGQRVVDPYRWLEDGDAEEVRQWTARQNEKTRRALDGPQRQAVRSRLLELMSIGFVASPSMATRTHQGKRTARYFFVRRTGSQDQAHLLVRDGLEGQDRVLVDPPTMLGDNTAALDWYYPSRDGELLAYGLSRGGDEDSILRVRNVSSGVDQTLEIPRTRHTSLAWLPDGSGFFYTREPDPGTVPKGEERFHRKVYLHRLGRHFSADPIVFPPPGRTIDPTDFPSVDLTPSGRWLIVTLSHGWSKSSVYLLDLAPSLDDKGHRRTAKKPDFEAVEAHATSGHWTTLVEGVDALFDVTSHHSAQGEVLLVRTNDGAERFRVMRVSPERPQRSEWRELVAETIDPLRGVSVVSETLFLAYLHDAESRIEARELDGTLREVLPLPTGTSSLPVGEPDGSEALFERSSFGEPPSIVHVTLSGSHRPAKLTTFTRIEVTAPKATPQAPSTFERDALAIDRIATQSRDGTEVRAWVVRLRNVPQDGTAAGLLNGYGGFNIAQTPGFLRSVHAFLERGGVYVLVNLRGGGEFGEAWHRAGMLANKQNVFDDAIAIAEALIARRYVSPNRLGLLGGSNGGLLVGALVTQRPDLFRAAVCQVPLLDMLRYHRFRLGRLWVAEYGSADDPGQFADLMKYSPYHHVADRVGYPAVLLTTAENDTRVDPLHARKMAARLQAATGSGRRVLLRVETEAGHGAGKPRSKQVEELADQYTFLFQELGM